MFETFWDFPVPDSDRKYQLFQLLGFNGIPLNTMKSEVPQNPRKFYSSRIGTGLRLSRTF